jgi:hypothetical protein
MQNESGRIKRFLAFLSRERAQVKPESTVTISVISASSLLALEKVSGNAVLTAITGLARLFV